MTQSDSRSTAARPMMKTTFHADLSDAHAGEDYWVQACGRRHRLILHTAESLAQLRASAPHLDPIPDHQLTHFTEQPILLPADQVVRVHIKHTLNTFSGAQAEHGIHHVAIHVPPPQLAASGVQAANTVHSQAIDWLSTAQSLLFHHPDLISQDVGVSSTIMGYMTGNKEISALINVLAGQMRQMGAPTESSGWARLVPFTPPYNEDNTAKGAAEAFNGTKTYYTHQPTDAIQTAAGPAMTAMMKATKNDMSLQGKKWQLQSGASLTPANPSPAQRSGKVAAADLVAGAAGDEDQWNAAVSNTSYVNGLKTSLKVVDANNRQVQLDLSNQYIRYLAAYIRFFDADGNAIQVPSWKPDDAGFVDDIVKDLEIQYDDLRFLGIISPTNSVLAIPCAPDGELSVKLTFPPKAVRATVYGSGLGTGADSWPRTPIIGGVMTALCNLTIPAFLLGFGVAAQSYKTLYDLMGNPKVIGALCAVGVGFFGTQFGTSAADKKMNWSALTTLVKLLFDKAATKALVWVEADLAAEEAAEQIPFAGWVVLAINIATGVAQIAETIIEVATSPWNIDNTIALSITTEVTVHPDPRSKSFPQGKGRHCSVKLIYKDEKRPTVVDSFDLADDATDLTLAAAFPHNTLGGQVKFEADFYVGDWLAGKATSGWMSNDETCARHVDLTLVEFPVPLTERTVFSHTQLLTYQGGHYAWKATASAPPYVAPNASPTGNAISAWNGITLSQRAGMVGLAWKAAGMGISSCVSGAGGQLYAMQNLTIPGTPLSALKFPSCGLDGQSMLVYDPYPPRFQMEQGQWKLDTNGRPIADPNDTPLGNYYLDPTQAAVDPDQGGGYHLRKVILDDRTPFNMGTQQLSCGRFPYQPDSITLHPSGYVVAVNTQYCKIQIAKLVLEGAPDQDVPLARVYAGEALNTNRPGLVFHPIAVTCSYDGTLMVLEDTKWSGGTSDTVVARVQAFDLQGNPVNRFFDDGGQPSSFLYLANPVNNNYLDMVAVGDQKMTYLFVLYNQADQSSSGNFLFFMDVYQYGTSKPDRNPLLTAKDLIGARITADMWHTVYTMNWQMVTDEQGHPAGPVTDATGPAGRTVPSVSQWTPSTPESNPGN